MTIRILLILIVCCLPAHCFGWGGWFGSSSSGNQYICSSAPTSDNQTLVCDNSTGTWNCCWGDVPRDGAWYLGDDDEFNAKSSFYSMPFKMIGTGDNATTEAVCQVLGSVCFNFDAPQEVYIGNGAAAIGFGGGGGGGGTATDFALGDDVCGSLGTGSDFLLCYDSGEDRLELRKSDNSTLVYWLNTGGMGMIKTADIPGTYLLYEKNSSDTTGAGISGPVITTETDTYLALPVRDNSRGSGLSELSGNMGAVPVIGPGSWVDSKYIQQMTPMFLNAIPASSYYAAHTYSVTECYMTVSGETTITVPTGMARIKFSVNDTQPLFASMMHVNNVGAASVTVNFADADDFFLNGTYYTSGKLLLATNEEVNCIGSPTSTNLWYCIGSKNKSANVTYAAD